MEGQSTKNICPKKERNRCTEQPGEKDLTLIRILANNQGNKEEFQKRQY